MIQIWYHMNKKEQDLALRQVCSRLGLNCKELLATQLNMPMAEIIGMKMPGAPGAMAPVFYAMPEVIFFAGMSSDKLDEFLAAYKAAGIPPVKLKAVLTPTNMNWTLYQLVEHLKEEAR